MVTFAPLDQRTTPDGVYEVLRHAILDGSLPPAFQLREVSIASDLGISRAPLREALARLEREGLVTKYPFRGAFVAEVSTTTIAEISELRFLLEPHAAARLSPEDGDSLMAAATALRAATATGDIPASIDAHLAYHRLFYELSGNTTLRQLWDGWESKLRLFLAVDHRSLGDLGDLAEPHERLSQLVLAKDLGQLSLEFAHHLHTAPGAPMDGKADQPRRKRPADRQLPGPATSAMIVDNRQM